MPTATPWPARRWVGGTSTRAAGHRGTGFTIASRQGLACRLLGKCHCHSPGHTQDVGHAPIALRPCTCGHLPSPSCPDPDVLCGMEPQGPHRGLALSRLRLEPALRCSAPGACSPCLEARLRLAVPRSTAGPGIPAAGHSGDAVRGSPELGDPSPQHNASGVLLLAAHTYTSSRCVAVEVWEPIGAALPGQTLVWRWGHQEWVSPTVTGHCGCWHRCISVVWRSCSCIATA